MIIGLFGAIIFVIVMIILSAIEVKQEQQSKPSARVSVSDGYRTVSSGKGNTVDEAYIQMFTKMYTAAQNAVKSETIQRRIDEMEGALHKCPSTVSMRTTDYCSSMLGRARARKRSVEAEEMRRRQEKQEVIKANAISEETKKLKAAQQKAEEATQKANAEKKKYQKKAAAVKAQPAKKRLSPEEMTPHQRFMYEQRRLMTDSLRYDVLKRDGFRCVLCGATAKDEHVKLHVDHITPISKGGRTELSNLRTLCERCNLGKSDKSEDDNKKDYSFPLIHDYTSSAFLKELTKRKLDYTIKPTARGQSVWIRYNPKQEAFIANSTVNGETIVKAVTTQFFWQGEWFVRI